MPTSTKLGSNNPFPSLLFVEQGSTPTTPDANQQRVYPKTANGHFHAVDDAGAERDLEAIQAVLTADPASPVDGTCWFFDDGGSPSSISLRVRKGGVTYDLPLGTLT